MKPFFAVGAIISGIMMLQGGMGLLIAILPLQMNLAGFSSFEVGIMTAGFSGGFLLGCIYAPGLITRIGHIRAFSVFATVLSAMTLAFAIDTSVMLWTAVRIVSGACFAGLLTVSDSWISSETDKSVRGQVMSIYMILYKLAQAAGPLVLTFATITGAWAFMMVSALFSLSLVPVALRHGGNPTPPSNERMGLLTVYKTTPLAVIGCVCLGLANSPIMNLTPIYSIEIGLGIVGAGILSSALQVGALVTQWPMGWASDHRDRRVVMIFGMVCFGILSAILAFAPPLPLWAYAILFGLLGGFAMSIYPVLLAHAGDFVAPDQMVPLCATLLLSFSFGMTVGPLTASTLMEYTGPSGLFLHAIIFCSIFVLFAVYRMSQRKAPVTVERRGYVNIPASSPAISSLDPRSSQSAIDEILEETFGHDPDDKDAGEEIPHYQPSTK